MLPDISKLHTKTILTIEGPTKRFPTKDGERERFDITFSDGYKAEFCPLVGITQNIPKSGQEFTFKIKHRGAKGDEIERAYVETQARDLSQGRAVVNMNGHPAVTALNNAVKLAEIRAGTQKSSVPGGLDKNGESVLTGDVLVDADRLLDWLLMKQNNC